MKFLKVSDSWSTFYIPLKFSESKLYIRYVDLEDDEVLNFVDFGDYSWLFYKEFDGNYEISPNKK